MNQLTKPLSIYLAGPEVFLPDAVAIGDAKRALCHQYGFAGLYPLDNEVQGSSPQSLGFAISAANEALIREADIVVANLTPFRGPSADVGTVYELGLARGLGKRIAGYSHDPRLYTQRSWEQCGDPQQPFTPGSVRDRDGLAIEEFGLHDNLMIEGGILLSGGLFLCAGVDETIVSGPDLHRLDLFEQVLQQLAAARDNGTF
ncbi:nucleoside 2-deoxyribosyltransferase [Parathalassolituus penaei]|uniref:Nucleoside 2-deoxyribosyltransferase n=1 Tax=Parathalassolituus penaei TaxID=2997323 RepID=A0A9X3EFA5_9GAMM|nr:nucleoside 2-deoxyribosyltransferase [Parathalassolituus penaei]MCY0966180.1 nucleoside 2-deoxyribosyltransferase [Parathalassolituus penaei]